jgi:hypothetical protein
MTERLKIRRKSVHAGLSEIAGDESVFEVESLEGDRLGGGRVVSHGITVSVCLNPLTSSFVSNFEAGGKLFADLNGDLSRFHPVFSRGFADVTSKF